MQHLRLSRVAPFVLVAIVAAACGGASPATPTPTIPIDVPITASPSPSSGATATASPTAAATASPTAAATPSGPPATPSTAPTPAGSPGPSATPVATTGLRTPGPVQTGPATLQAPDSLSAGTPFNIDWTGPNNQGDFIALLAASATVWTNEPWFYTNYGTPGQLVAPTTPGAYKLAYIDGTSRNFKAERPLTVTEFVGSVSGPASVAAGTVFTASWTGPNAPGDYITIVAMGTTEWTNESWFYTGSGPSGSLTAPLTDGAHELWYVAADRTVMARSPITVTPLVASVSGPASANKGSSISVNWTGPNAPGDYITIVPVGAAEGSYTTYAYTGAGNPVSITAPDTAGNFELRYVYGSTAATIASAAIQIK